MQYCTAPAAALGRSQIDLLLRSNKTWVKRSDFWDGSPLFPPDFAYVYMKHPNARGQLRGFLGPMRPIERPHGAAPWPEIDGKRKFDDK